MYPFDIIKKFDDFISSKNQLFEAIVIGGAALSILGVISRETRDVDVLFPNIPEDIVNSSIEFAAIHNLNDYGLKENWLNMGPNSLAKDLPDGWQDRLVDLYLGKSIKLTTLGRIDFLRVKVLAYCDRGFDLQDCIKMNPTKEELIQITPWIQKYDENPSWPEYVIQRINELSTELGHEL